MTGSLDDYRWLSSEEARPWLAKTSQSLSGRIELATLVAKLRRDLSAERVHLVLQQVELRRRAREKFSLADEMYFTSLGLAQSTDEMLARYKASRFDSTATVADLCCGLGGDLIALAEGRQCVGVDRDPIAAHLALANAQVYGRRDVKVECREVASAVLADCDEWHIDPDRRAAGKRTVQAEIFEPPWNVVEELLIRREHASVKLAPATDLPASVSQRCEREWIQSRGECREQVAWFGRLANRAGQRRATVIDTRQGLATVTGDPHATCPLAESVGQFVYEPCAAVRAAQLTGVLSLATGAAELVSGGAYLTSDAAICHPLLSAYQVLESLPFDMRRLRQVLRRLQIGPLEIKKRGMDVDPAALVKQLSSTDGQPAVLLLAVARWGTVAIVARRQ